MSKLMLISGLEDRVSILKLIDYLKATYLVQNVWMDPHGEPRVVVLCDKKLDLSDIKIKSRYLETAKPTASVFVKTYKCITFGAKDKLKYLFTSQRYGGRKVVKVEQLNTKDDDCYELYFLNWGDVLKICNETWKVEEQTLTVIPFFESFKEPFKQQLKRLNDLNETSTQAKIIFVPETQTVNRPSVMLKPSEMPRKLSFQGANASVDLKSAKPLLEHRYILTLLHLLNFEHAVQHKYNMVTVTICERNWEVEIKGPVASLKIIQKLLTEEDELDHPALIERFLGNMTALQDLKNFIDSAGLYVDIVDTQGKPFLQVTDGAERKEIFHDFIFTLVISKECSPLPSRECQQQQEWTNFVELFDRTYTHQQLFVEDTSVTLVCLASKSLEMDFIVNIINNTIIQLKRDLKAGSHKDDYVPTPDQNSMIPDESSQSSGNTSSAGGKENTKFKQLTIGIQNSAFLWILNILNLKNSLRQTTHNLDVDIDEDEEEITISGSKDLLQRLKAVLTMEDKKFQFTENEKVFLCDPIVRRSLNSCLITHGCCIVLQDDLEMFVARKDGHKAQFKNFLTSFIQFKTISHLSEEYQKTKEWNSLLEYCKNNYPHHHILTAKDTVYLLSIGPEENNTDADSVLKKVDKVITALTSSGLPEKHLSLAEERGDQKCEEFKTDGGKISASDKSSRRKLTLYYKHPILIRILQTLQLKEAAQKFGICVTMSSDHEIIIEGSKKSVKSLQSSLIKEDEMPFEDQEEFLMDKQVQQNIESYLKASEAHLVLDDNLELFVVTKSGEKAQFRHFLTSFLHFKTVSLLPEEYQQTKEWNSLLEHCNNNYPHHHIFTVEDKVYLLSIAPDEHNTDADLVLKKVDKVITALTSSGLPGKHLSLAEEIGDQKCEDIKTNSGKISASGKSSMKKLTLYYKHPVLIRILQNLQLKEATQKFGICVTMSSDHEIIIEGSKKTVRSLQSSLIKEDNEMPFEDQEEFLMDKQVQQNVESCLKASEAHLVLDDNLELFVVTKSGEQAQFRHFLTSFLHFKTVSLLPEEYQQTKEWNSLLEHCNNKYPHHHIFTVEDKVYLLSIAPDEHNTDADSVLKKVDKVITALTSSGLPGKHLSLAEEIGDQKCEDIKTNSGKISASGKSSMKKLTLYYKHPVLIRILQNLQLKKATQKFGISVTMPSDHEIIIEGSKKTVRSLQSSLIKEDNEHLSLAEETGDQKCEDIKTNSGKISASDKSSTKKLTLYYKHPVLIRILKSLQLKEATQKFGISVTMSSDHEIIIEGSKKVIKSLQSALIKEDNEMPFEDQEEFFTNPRVDHYLVSCLKDSSAHLVLNDSLELFVVTESGEKEQFTAFITRFIQFRKCAHMPEKYQNNFAWKTKLQKFEEQNPHHHILINGEEIHLLTIACDDKSHEADSVMERINKAISDSCLPHDSDMRDEDEHHDFFIKCHKIKINYFSTFMIKELQDEYEKWQSCNPKVTFMEDCLRISSSSSDATTKIASKLEKLLSTIKHQTKPYTFPGLSAYLNSTGTSLINMLSDRYRCLIDVPDRDNSHPQHLSLNEEHSSEISQGLAYKVIFLGTANCGSFNIHLVQGDLNNLKLEMKIQLQPSEEVETCEIRQCGSSQNLLLHLPPWLVPNEDDSHSFLEELRSSFYNAISVAFEQAEHLGHNDIAFSTALLTKSQHPFPPSVIAKGIIEILCEKTGLNLASSQTENTLVDIYVCEPENEAVFKAFQFFLKRRHKYLGTPSQVSWDKVCFPDSYKYPDYNSFKSQGIHIEVSSKIPFSLGNNTCICYPIHPSLEISTCPALKENSFAERALKSSLQDLQRKNPDGLLIGEIFPLSGFFDGRNSFVYCSPDWGVDCDQAVDRILEACIGKSGHCDVIYIVPPGIQMLSKYPVGYLVQIFFRKLDSIMQNKTYLLNKKKCVLLVQDFVYRKAFDQELQKRYPKPKERGIIEGFLNLFRSTEQDNVSSNSPKTICKTSSVPSTEIVLWSTSEDNIQKMAQELGKQLSNLMKDNTMSRQLNKEETRRFLNKVHNFQSRDIQVSISITEYYEMESHFQEQHKKKQKKKKQKHSGHVKRDSNQIILSSSILSIEGLDKHYLHEFLSKTGLARDMDEHGNFFQKEALQEETSVPVKNSEKDLKKETSFPKETSVKSIENAKSFGGNDRQQEQNSKFSKNKLATNSVRLQANCHHKWLQQSARGDSFEMIKTEIGQNIEDAYIKGKDQQELNGDTSVDFTSMTVTINGAERNIIRIEVLGKDFILQKIQKLTKVGDNTGKYQEIKSNLDECIGKYKLSLIEISEVPKNTLHIRFEKKSADLKDKSVDSLWHRILSNYKQHVCTYGFHPKFSGMPDAKHLGEGVLFCKEPENCFNLEVEKEEEILLVYSKVLIGRSCSGAPGLRCLPSDETTGRCFDSVSENGAYMIFSDAQAYPEYVVTLKVKK